MDKYKLENELATAIMWVLSKHIKTGYKDGYGEFLECKIDFKYLHNMGALEVKHLKFESKESDYVEPDR